MGYVKKRHWLEIAEYVSLAGSAVGIVAAAVSQQFVYVGLTVPLTLAVFFDIINRQQFLRKASLTQELYQQQTDSIVADVRSVVESLHQEVKIQTNTQKSEELQETLSKDINRLVTAQVEQSARSWAIQINQHLERIKPYDYELVIDRPASRAVLLEALETTQERLIIVNPWLTQSSIDREVLQGFNQALARQVSIDIGWGNFRDTGLSEPAIISRQQLLTTMANGTETWKYEALPELEELERRYPGKFRLKLLLTHEKFLVSLSSVSTKAIGSFAMLGSHDLLTWGSQSIEREVGLRTNDPRIVTDLMNRFDRAVNYDFAYNSIGNGRKNSLQLSDAIATYQRIIETDPTNAIAYQNIALVLMSQGKQLEAIAIYRKLLQLEPNNPVIYTSLGNALLEVGNRSEAFATYQKVLEIDPTYTYAYNNLGKVLEDEGKLAEALDIYRQALIQPEQLGKPASAHTLAHNNAGVVLAKLGKLKEAIAEFQAAIELDPTYTEARNNLQKAQFLLGSG